MFPNTCQLCLRSKQKAGTRLSPLPSSLAPAFAGVTEMGCEFINQEVKKHRHSKRSECLHARTTIETLALHNIVNTTQRPH
jgi:hypothetical protein